MLIQPLAAFLLLVRVATGGTLAPDDNSSPLSVQQKHAATQPLITSATECILKSVVADPNPDREIGDRIVDAVPVCIAEVRAMIAAFDRYYGAGAGESFFLGPYLDVLPAAVNRRVHGSAP
jgi:hypothetical protein